MQGQGYAAGVAEGAGCGSSVAVWGRSISPFSHSVDFWGGVGMAHPTHLAMSDKAPKQAALGTRFSWWDNALPRQTRRLTRNVTGRFVLQKTSGKTRV